jgi:hypothetical protein
MAERGIRSISPVIQKIKVLTQIPECSFNYDVCDEPSAEDEWGILLL